MRKMLMLAAALAVATPHALAKEAPKQDGARQEQKQAREGKKAIDPERLALARKMMKTTGADKIALQIMHTMMPQITGMLVRARPDKKEQIIQLMKEVGKELSAEANMDKLVDQIARIYAEEFTAEEMRQILAFYDTPVGRKLIGKMPSIVMRSQQAGRVWGQEVARKAIQRIRKKAKERGIDL